jgi:hypothetical protein
MYRGLVDSTALNGPLGGIGVTRLSTARFASPDGRKGGTSDSGGAVLDDTCTTTNPQRNLHIKTLDEESLGSKTA